MTRLFQQILKFINSIKWYAIALFGFLFIRRERQNAKKELLLEQAIDGKKAQSQWDQKVHEITQTVEKEKSILHEALSNMDVDDPRHNDILYKSATDVLKDVHNDQTRMGKGTGKKTK